MLFKFYLILVTVVSNTVSVFLGDSRLLLFLSVLLRNLSSVEPEDSLPSNKTVVVGTMGLFLVSRWE